MELLFSAVFFFLGAILASFSGVISERLHTGEKWMMSRSKCNSCNRVLAPQDLVPVLSWLSSRGKCRTCFARIPVSYVVGEFMLGSLFVLSYFHLGFTLSLFVFLAALVLLYIIVLYDLRHMIVPHILSWPLIGVSLIFLLLNPASLGTILVTAGVLGFIFLGLHVFSKGRMMGLGDAPVVFALSLLVGTQAISGLVFSFWIGAVIGICILVLAPRGHRIGIEVPFVPFLALGYVLAFFSTWNPFFFTSSL